MTAFIALSGALPAEANATEAGAAQMFDRLVHQPGRLRIFLQAMPKGGDLHNHLWGAPYAEDFLGWAATDGLCISRAAKAIVPAPCNANDTPPAQGLGSRDPALYATMIDALSMRNYVHGAGAAASGHDQFFDSFDRFAAAALPSTGRMIAVAVGMAARDHVSYVELMSNPDEAHDLGMLAQSKPWTATDFAADLAGIERDLPKLVTEASAATDTAQAEARTILGCGAAPSRPACAVTVRFQAFALRSQAPAYVFGQLAFAFALAEKDHRYVGVNIVAPEDGPVAMADYDLHMHMLRFFAARHKSVRLSLHAGELTLGLVPALALRNHIHDAVEIAGASRIGHGVDIAFEDDAPALMSRMARDHIAVEINLTSNDGILGVRGTAHPLAAYRAAGVPVVLSTDDEGVSRSDMTNEYLRAATEQGLRYVDLKTIARASLEYAFLPGQSLWQGGVIGSLVPACQPVSPTPACDRLLAASEKATAQWRLETEFRAFETAVVAQAF